MQETNTETNKIITSIIEDEMKRSYLDYAMSVIVSRALPDVRDGLKPVHRRILFAMNDMGMHHNKPYKKSARIVGECLGKYHPHGDSSVYEAMVRMAQDFSLRYPLVNGQGNFGSVDGDSAAAMRYCVTGDTLVLTDKGIIPINEISNKKEEKINIKIINYNGKKTKASKFFNSGKHKTIKIETKQGYFIEGSFNHPLLIWTLNEYGSPSIKWKLIQDIKKEDFIIINREHNLFAKNNLNLTNYKVTINKKNKKVTFPKIMNKNLAFLLGALVAEGSFHQEKILFTNSDLKYYNQCKKIFETNFKGINFYERTIKGNCKEFSMSFKTVVEFLDKIGFKKAKSENKEIPFSILLSNKETIVSFLKGLFEGDGSVILKNDKRHNGKSIELTYNSKSKKLIDQIKILLLNFGIITTKPYMDKRNKCYKLIISGVENITKFRNEIGFFSDRKNTILSNIDKLNKERMSKTDYIPFLNQYLRKNYTNQIIQKNNFDRYNNLKKRNNEISKILSNSDQNMIKWLLKHNFFFNQVEKITTSKNKKIVYSIKVNSECHSYCANGFINHNTEARMNKMAEEILADIDKNTVKFVKNFDGSLEEPSVLPSKIPTLLINGASGIAVGMATNIPPHNLTEVCEGIIKYIDNPEITIKELMQTIKGPDFPTGGIIATEYGIEQAFTTGRGKIKVKSRYTIEEHKGKERIIIHEIPYQVNKAMLIQQIAELVKDKKVLGISDLRDESDRDGMRIVIELKKDAQSDIVVNQLMKYSRMKVTFGINTLALVNNEPKTLSLTSVIGLFVKHRQDVIRRKTEFELDKAQKRSHILEGLVIALDNIDEIVQKIKESKNTPLAIEMLVADYSLSDEQAKAILDMKLQKLSGMEQEKLRQEHLDLSKLIIELKEILASEPKILEIIKNEMIEIKEKYGDKRKTDIIFEPDEGINLEDLIEEEDVVVTISHQGYIKRLAIDTYRQQRRGGKGVIGATTKDEDFTEYIFIANTHSYVLFFTDDGQMHWLKVYNIPEASRQSKGKAIINLINIKDDHKLTAFVPVREFKNDHFLFMATDKGVIKKTPLELFAKPRKGGIRAISLDEDEKLINVLTTNGNNQIILASRNGLAAKFHENTVRPMGRSAHGVIGMRLKPNDKVVGAVIAKDEKTLLTVTENGFGKRTPISDYRLINRGGRGVINIQCSERNGNVAAIKSVEEIDDLLLISKKGIVIRTNVHNISIIGRNTQGVRLMRIKEGDKVVAAAKIIAEQEEESIVENEVTGNNE